MRMVAMMAIMTTTMTMTMTMMTTISCIMIYGTDLAHLILKPLSGLLSRGVHILLFPSPLLFFVEQRTRLRLFLSFHLPFSFSHARVTGHRPRVPFSSQRSGTFTLLACSFAHQLPPELCLFCALPKVPAESCAAAGRPALSPPTHGLASRTMMTQSARDLVCVNETQHAHTFPVFLFGKQQQADVFGGTSEGVETIKQALAQIERGGKTAGRLWHETLPQFRRSGLRPTKIHSCAYEETQDRVARMVGGNYGNEQ